MSQAHASPRVRAPRRSGRAAACGGCGGGDLTTEALGLHGQRGHVVFFARGPMTIAGTELAAAMFMRRGVPVVLHRRSGETVTAGAQLLAGDGDAADLHLVFKAAQTMVETLSGMATAARAMVDAVEAVNPNVRVACTRKAFPGGRRLSHVAVTAGGAILHRAGLSETILDLRRAPRLPARQAARRRHGQAAPRRPREEDRDRSRRHRRGARGDRRRFRHPPAGKVQRRSGRRGRGAPRARAIPPLIAAAGGVTVANAADYVRAGAGMIVTSAPSGPADVNVSIAEVKLS